MNHEFWKKFSAIIDAHNRLSFQGRKQTGYEGIRRLPKPVRTISVVTRQQREERLRSMFLRLHELGFGIESPTNLKPHHIHALVKDWAERKVSASVISNSLSLLRGFCEWINKGGMVGGTKQLLIACGVDPAIAERKRSPREDRSWLVQGIDPVTKILEIARTDARVASAVSLQLAFGMRMQLAAHMKPYLAHQGNTLFSARGIKMGHGKTYNIDHDGQRTALDWAKALVESGDSALKPDDMPWVSWRNRFHYVCRKHGIKSTEQIVPDESRQEHLANLHRVLRGPQSPVPAKPNFVPDQKAVEKRARQIVAETAGHSRIYASRAYLGQFLRSSTKPEKYETVPEAKISKVEEEDGDSE